MRSGGGDGRRAGIGGRGRTITRTRTAVRSSCGGAGGTRRWRRCRSRRRKGSAVVCIANLFAFVELHASRWRRLSPDYLMERRPPGVSLTTLDYAPMYYDRQGFPIPCDPETARDEPGWFMPVLEWVKRQQDRDYVIVARDELPDGSWLSTVWLGFDHAHGL